MHGINYVIKGWDLIHVDSYRIKTKTYSELKNKQAVWLPI